MERFKKGQMVVKSLGLVRVNKSKMQHLCVFGTDVEVEGKNIKATGDGSVLCIARGHIGGTKSRQKEIARFIVENVHVTHCASAIALCKCNSLVQVQ